MSIRKTKTEKIFELLGKSFKSEIQKYIDLKVEEKLSQLKQNDTNSKSELTAQEVCDKYKIHKSTLERHVRNGLVPTTAGKGCKRTFNIVDLENFFKSSRKSKRNG